MRTLKIYLAAAWSRRDEIAGVARQLEQIPGIEITSRWLHEPTVLGHKIVRGNTFRRRRAQEDVADVRKAEMLVRFSDDLSGPTVPATLATGSRMFEMGLAYAEGKKVVVVGGTQPIFDYLPRIVHLRHVDELKSYLRGIPRHHRYPVVRRKKGKK
jgi:hypothetical protein